MMTTEQLAQDLLQVADAMEKAAHRFPLHMHQEAVVQNLIAERQHLLAIISQLPNLQETPSYISIPLNKDEHASKAIQVVQEHLSTLRVSDALTILDTAACIVRQGSIIDASATHFQDMLSRDFGYPSPSEPHDPTHE